MLEKGTRKIDVTLVPGANPPVQVDHEVDGDSKIEWKKSSGSADFEILSLDINATVFTDEELGPQKRKIKVKDDTAKKGDYEYVLSVKGKEDGKTYTTTKQIEDPDGDKPVIRN